MTIHHNYSLKQHNTFGIDVSASKFISVKSISELKDVLRNENNSVFILGGGSNMLLTQNLKETVVHLNLKGITIDQPKENSVEVTASAGENWHEFVLWTIDQNYGGLENLSLIPGNVGACPIQNIGAYGVEVKDTITRVEVLHKKTLETKHLSNKECQFGYRNSVFKNEYKDQYIITSVTFRLSTKNHTKHIDYGAIKQELGTNTKPSIKEISSAIINIRNSKLPNPKEIGNSGSFFKNPVIDLKLFHKIQDQYPHVPYYTISDHQIKVPAGWLIETAGFKGKKFGNTGVHQKQALVLVNHGQASGKEIYTLAQTIQTEIKLKFNIDLEIEVNIF